MHKAHTILFIMRNISFFIGITNKISITNKQFDVRGTDVNGTVLLTLFVFYRLLSREPSP